MQTLFITLPIFFLIAIGYLLRRYKVLSEETSHTLSQFVYRVRLPAAILAAFWGIDWSNPAEKIYNQINQDIPMGVGQYNEEKNLTPKTKKEFQKLLEKFQKNSHDKNILHNNTDILR